MRKLLAALVAALALSGPAAAATVTHIFYVDPTSLNGDSRDGLTPSTAWRTIDWANSHNGGTTGGDTRIYLLPGTHIGRPSPSSQADSGFRYQYIGAGPVGSNKDPISDSTFRRTIIVNSQGTGQYITKTSMTIAGVSWFNGCGIDSTARFDTLLAVHFVNDGNTYLNVDGADYITWDRCSFDVTHANLNRGNDITSTSGNGTFGAANGSMCTGLTFTDCKFWKIGVGWTTSFNVWTTSCVDSLDMRFCTRFMTAESGVPADVGLEWHFAETNSRYRYNRTYMNIKRLLTDGVWRYRADNGHAAGSGKSNIWGCHHITYRGDTLIAWGVGGRFTPSASATASLNYPDGAIGCWNLTMDSCLVNASACSDLNTYFEYQGGMWDVAMHYTTIAMRGQATRAFDVKGTNVFDHCTLAGFCDPLGQYNGRGVFAIVDDTYGRPSIKPPSTLTVTNSIVYSFTSAGANDQSSGNAAISFARVKIDSTGLLHLQPNLICNRNLYYYKGYTNQPGERSEFMHSQKPAQWSMPGDSGGTWAAFQHIEPRWNVDSLSRWGSPVFIDSLPGTGFDGTLGVGSLALGWGSGGTDVGAVRGLPTADVYVTPTQLDFWGPDTLIVSMQSMNGLGYNTVLGGPGGPGPEHAVPSHGICASLVLGKNVDVPYYNDGLSGMNIIGKYITIQRINSPLPDWSSERWYVIYDPPANWPKPTGTQRAEFQVFVGSDDECSQRTYKIPIVFH